MCDVLDFKHQTNRNVHQATNPDFPNHPHGKHHWSLRWGENTFSNVQCYQIPSSMTFEYGKGIIFGENGYIDLLVFTHQRYFNGFNDFQPPPKICFDLHTIQCVCLLSIVKHKIHCDKKLLEIYSG